MPLRHKNCLPIANDFQGNSTPIGSQNGLKGRLAWPIFDDFNCAVRLLTHTRPSGFRYQKRQTSINRYRVMHPLYF